MPFLAYIGEEGNGHAEILDFKLIRRAIGECFNATHLVKMRTKFSTWHDAIGKGTWEEQRPKYLWPSTAPASQLMRSKVRVIYAKIPISQTN